jgi:hypothetical protein
MHADSPLAKLKTQYIGHCCCGMFRHAVRSDEGECVDSYKPKLRECILRNQNINSPILNTSFQYYIAACCYHSVQNLLSSRLLSRNVNRIHLTIILPVILSGCETCSLTLRKEYWLSVSGNRVPRRIFELKRDEVTGGRRKLHNEELNGLYSSPSIIRMITSRIRWAGNVPRMSPKRRVF